ncbi:hypothetical protein HYQ40_08850 [Aerococcaceae bacterium DSM 111021]|nr:hypothetical protein [Aerococcaceae bacterium DSM 111021]
MERTFDSEGKALHDKHYSDHGNAKNHPKVPHEHDWDWSNPNKPNMGDWY